MPEEPTFKIGDQVVHKLGGPVMVVASEPDAKGSVTCEWLDKKSNSIVGRPFNRGVLTPFVPVEASFEEPKPVQFPFKEGDKVRSNTGTDGLTVGVIQPDADPKAQVPCHWTSPAVEAVEATEGKPAILAQPAKDHVTMFWPSQLTLIKS